MTTYTFTTAGQYNNTDARHRALGIAINAAFAAIGLVQTADTGQANWATQTFPTLGTYTGGYEIWRFNDALQGSAPIFFKIEYGSGNSGGSNGVNNNMQLRITWGTGSNGAGTITGPGSAVAGMVLCGVSATGSITAITSYVSMVGGKLSVALFADGLAPGHFGIHRTCDTTGADTATGALAFWTAAGSNMYCTGVNFSTSTVVYSTQTGVNMLRVGNVAASQVAGSNSAYLAWNAMPAPVPHIGVCGVIGGEIAIGSTFTATLFGSTPHTYIYLGGRGFGAWPAGSGLASCILWE